MKNHPVLVVLLLVMLIFMTGCMSTSTPSADTSPSAAPKNQTDLNNPGYSDEVTELFNRAHELNNQGQWEEAITIYRWVLQKEPDNADAWIGTSYGYYRMEKYEEALAADEKALALKPSDALLWTHKGHILNALGRNEEAQEAYTRATQVLQENPNPNGSGSYQRGAESSTHNTARQRVDTLLTCRNECFETKNACAERCVKSERDSSAQLVCLNTCRDDENTCNQQCDVG